MVGTGLTDLQSASWVIYQLLACGTVWFACIAFLRVLLGDADPHVRYLTSVVGLVGLPIVGLIGCLVLPAPVPAWEFRESTALVLMHSVAPWVWLAGSLLVSLGNVIGIFGAERLRRSADYVINSPMTTRCRQLAAEMGIRRSVRVGISSRVTLPILFGVLRPTILLPAAGVTGWTPRQLEFILLHELSHVRRWDNLCTLFQRALEGVLFFHPGVWLLSRWVEEDRELCCDDTVVARTRQPLEYASFLAELASRRPLALPISEGLLGRRHILVRVNRLVNKGDKVMRVSRSSSTVIMVGTAMALLLAGSLPGISPAESELSAESAASNAGRQAAAPTPIADAGTDGREPAQVDEELPPPTPFTVFGKPTRAAATEVRASQANWGPQQLLGEPDTLQAGDIPTAWASLSEDDQREWLILTYEDAVTPKAVMIHETYNPGAVDKVSVFDENGEEVIAWMGKDPTSPADPKGVSVIPIRVDFEVKKVKVYINSPQVPGWNEIDAVGLRDADGNTQWAIDAKVSSTYATLAGDAPVPQTVMISAEELQRIRRLETRVKDLEKEVKRLKSIENKLTKVLKLLDADEK